MASHGPFAWGVDVAEAVENAIALETVAELALYTLVLKAETSALDDDLLERHFTRKHGPRRLLRAAPMIALRLHDRRDLRLARGAGADARRRRGPGARHRRRAVRLRPALVRTRAASATSCLTRPLVLGHEFVGVIETGARTGERVALDPAIACGALRAVPRRPREPLHRLHGSPGNSIDGALRSRLAWPERLAHRVPDSLPDVEAALLEPLGVALHALDLGHVRPGATAGVYGCGPLGLLLVQLLRRAGVNVLVATDPLPHRVAAAEALGATVAVETRRAGMEILPGGSPRRPSTSRSRWPATTTRSRLRSTRCDPAAASSSWASPTDDRIMLHGRRPHVARSSRSSSAAG